MASALNNSERSSLKFRQHQTRPYVDEVLTIRFLRSKGFCSKNQSILQTIREVKNELRHRGGNADTEIPKQWYDRNCLGQGKRDHPANLPLSFECGEEGTTVKVVL